MHREIGVCEAGLWASPCGADWATAGCGFGRLMFDFVFQRLGEIVGDVLPRWNDNTQTW
jgi:hypothetical protein